MVSLNILEAILVVRTHRTVSLGFNFLSRCEKVDWLLVVSLFSFIFISVLLKVSVLLLSHIYIDIFELLVHLFKLLIVALVVLLLWISKHWVTSNNRMMLILRWILLLGCILLVLHLVDVLIILMLLVYESMLSFMVLVLVKLYLASLECFNHLSAWQASLMWL